MMKIRIKFSKHGVIRFIGHLDIMRYFQKAFRRAELDIAYSAGYSPHQIMSFASALSVGVESNGEYMDVTLNSLTSLEDLVTRLNEQMAEGMQILSAKFLPDNARNAMASVAAASYNIRFRDSFVPTQGWESAISDFMSQEIIEVIKKTDKSERVINLRTSIYDFKISSSKENSIYLMVDASSGGNIKPSLVMEQIYNNLGYTFDAFNILLTRDDMYLNSGTIEEPVFEPLDAIGSTNREQFLQQE